MGRFGKLAAAVSATLVLAAAGSAGAVTVVGAPSSASMTHTLAAQPHAVGVQPVTWAIMILGFGLAGSALRRRRAT